MAVMREAGVNVQLIDASGSGRITRYDIVCVHTIVGRDPASAAHFSTGGYGEKTQSRDTLYRSAANLNGNYRIIAIENEDRGAPFPDWNVNDGRAVPAFTAAQCESIAEILAWCHKTHGIPLVFVTDSRPTTRGVAFHRAGCDGNFAGYAFGGRISGGELWSTAYGKVCPGDRRIFQLRDIIIPRARVLAGLDQGRGTVAVLDNEDYQKIAEAILNFRADWPNESRTYTESRQLWELFSFPFYWTADTAKHNVPAVLNAVKSLRAEMLKEFADLDSSEARIVAAVRDPGNPATAELLARVLAGVTAIVEADEDAQIVVGPEHLEALAEAFAEVVPQHLRPMFGQVVASVLTRGTEEYPSSPPEQPAGQ